MDLVVRLGVEYPVDLVVRLGVEYPVDLAVEQVQGHKLVTLTCTLQQL